MQNFKLENGQSDGSRRNERSRRNNQTRNSPSHNHDSAAPRQHSLICTGAGQIHPVHGQPMSLATKAIPRNEVTFSPFSWAFVDNAWNATCPSESLCQVILIPYPNTDLTIVFRSITCKGVLACVFVGARVRCCLNTGKTVKLACMLARTSLLPVVQTCLLAGEHDAGTLGGG